MARYKWKLLAGKHAEGRGENLTTYHKGDIIETDKDLSKIFNSPDPGLKQKFELVADSGSPSVLVTNPAPQPSSTNLSGSDPKAVADAARQGYETINQGKSAVDDTLESMSVAELKRFAEAEEIDLAGATRKEDILKTIRAATVNV